MPVPTFTVTDSSQQQAFENAMGKYYASPVPAPFTLVDTSNAQISPDDLEAENYNSAIQLWQIQPNNQAWQSYMSALHIWTGQQGVLNLPHPPAYQVVNAAKFHSWWQSWKTFNNNTGDQPAQTFVDPVAPPAPPVVQTSVPEPDEPPATLDPVGAYYGQGFYLATGLAALSYANGDKLPDSQSETKSKTGWFQFYQMWGSARAFWKTGANPPAHGA